MAAQPGTPLVLHIADSKPHEPSGQDDEAAIEAAALKRCARAGSASRSVQWSL
jgi:hypothetical protein